MSDRRFETAAVHAGATEDNLSGFRPVAEPLHLAVSYVADEMAMADAVFAGERDGYVYGRYGNPTVRAFERAMADLERGEDAIAFGSGMAAVHAALLGAGAWQGRTLVSAGDVYGATYALQQSLLTEQGVRTVFVDSADRDQVEQALEREHPAALVCETISNPLLKVADLGWLAEAAHAVGAALVVDHTFATPYLARPLELGADYVVHSATKYIAGHDDVMAGVVVGSAERMDDLRQRQKLLGANCGPQQAWLALRGIRTLALRMAQHCANASRVSEWLAQHGPVASINYPGLPGHPQHDLAKRLFGARGFGGMISFELRGADKLAVFRFMDALRLVQPATTLGDVFSLVLYPAHSSHRALPPETRRALGISDGLVRMSVGIEHADDIIADLERAMRGAV